MLFFPTGPQAKTLAKLDNRYSDEACPAVDYHGLLMMLRVIINPESAKIIK